MDLLSLVEQDVTMRRASSTNGGEYAGPCPGCGGHDRFRVWPEQGRYWCRRCEKQGDLIQYLRDFRGLSFQDAARTVGKVLGDYQPHPTEDALWRYLEEQYEALHEEMTLITWASLAINKNPDRYSDDERMDWAIAAVTLLDWYAQTETLWRKVQDGTRTGRARVA